MSGTIVFVHGTGVRLAGSMAQVSVAVKVASQCGVQQLIVPCDWGDALGSLPAGNTIPGQRTTAELAQDAEDFASWNWLLEDPLAGLYMLTLGKAKGEVRVPGQQKQWQVEWDKISRYLPSDELGALLERFGYSELWPGAWRKVISSPLTIKAFELSSEHLVDAAEALARAAVAQLHVDAVETGVAGPSPQVRRSMVQMMLMNWNFVVYGAMSFLQDRLRRVATWAIKKHRRSFSQAAAAPIGDILLYQSQGEAVRRLIGKKVATATGPVILLGHSLGGIACVDLLVKGEAPDVTHLITVGSQAPYLHELGALASLRAGEKLPTNFPKWLNVYDSNDFLSFLAEPVFPAAQDVEISSGQPFPESHSAYFGNEALWTKISEFTRA